MNGKKYKEQLKKIDKTKIYDIAEGLKLAKETSFTKFVSSIDVVFKLNLDTTKQDQALRGTITLPHGNGKKIRIVVLSSENRKEIEKLGVELVGGNEVIDKLKVGWVDFDLLITTPEFMPQLGKLGKVLGPKGLMPNPKSGTVTKNILKTVEEFKKGKVGYRSDKDGNINFSIGNTSFTEKELKDNYDAILSMVLSIKPSTVKGKYIENISVSSTMGPGIKINIT